MCVLYQDAGERQYFETDGQATGLDDNGFAGPMDPWPYWTKHEDGAFVSAAVRVDAQRYFISRTIAHRRIVMSPTGVWRERKRFWQTGPDRDRNRRVGRLCRDELVHRCVPPGDRNDPDRLSPA